MIQGTTESGFVFEIADEAADDMEILEGLCQIDAGQIGGLMKVIERLLGSEQKEMLYAFCSVDGRVSARKVIEALREIMEAAGGAVKN